jgi:hypothetical protein
MRRLPAGPAVVFALLASCVTTTITKTWRDPNFSGPPLRKVLVCSIARDDVTRRRLEDEFVRQLRVDGVTGIPSYTVLPEGQTTAEQVRNAAASQGVDGLIITLPAHVKVTPIYGPGPGWMYGAYPWGPYYSAWGSDWGAVYGPSYVGEETRVSIQAKAYSAQQNGELVWAGTSQTIDASSIATLVGQIVPRFISAMAASGVLPRAAS